MLNFQTWLEKTNIVKNILVQAHVGIDTTNLHPYSNNFSAGWTKSYATDTITDNTSTFFDGTLTGARYVCQNTQSVNRQLYPNNNITGILPSTAYTYSIYIKPYSTWDWIGISLTSDTTYTSGIGNAVFSLTSISTGLTQNIGGTIQKSTITKQDNGWFRLSITGITSSSTTNLRPKLVLLDSNTNFTGTTTSTGVVGSGLQLGGAQLEQGNILSNLVVTLGNSSVRNQNNSYIRYLSTKHCVVWNQEYLGIVKVAPIITESVSLDYSSNISFGDIELYNNSGIYDTWLNDTWVNKPLRVYVGEYISTSTDLTNDYELIFDGVCEDIDSRAPEVLNLKIRDKLFKLNYPVSESLLGNYYQGSIVPTGTYVNQNSGKLKPLVFGEVNNISPLLADPTLLEYMAHNGDVEQIIEVLDNGVPVSFTTTGTPTIPAGSFRLSASPSGTITCSVQGDKRTVSIGVGATSATYTNTASNIISLLLTAYGKGLAYTDLDATSFAAYGTQGVGVYLQERANMLEICQSIAKSCGLCLYVTRKGLVKLTDITIPGSSTMSITDSNILFNSLKISQKVPVIGSVKLGYAKNYTVMTGLMTGIPEQHKNLYATEYLEVLQEDATVKIQYSLMAEPTLEETYLVDLTQATTVASTKLNLFKTPRKVISMTCTSKMLSLEVGTAVTVTSSRFGLSGGVLGRVISTKPDWIAGKIDIEVLV